MSRPEYTLRDVKAALRAGPYAWPGGYPLYFLAADGEALSFDAVRAMFRTVCADMHGDSDWRGASTPHAQFRLIACEPNWEDSALYCAHTGKRIPSAYAEPEEEESAA